MPPSARLAVETSRSKAPLAGVGAILYAKSESW
jgi:hypothetical protein